MADFVARYTLARLGPNSRKDVTIVQTGSTPQRLADSGGYIDDLYARKNEPESAAPGVVIGIKNLKRSVGARS
jgi:hypothetical protein